MEPAALLNELERDFRLVDPDFEVRFKNESFLMKVLGVLTAPFNPEFMTDYVTTLGSKVYFPDQSRYHQKSSPGVLCHEFVHITDNMRHGWRYTLSYLLPQLVVVAPVVAMLLAPSGPLTLALLLLAYLTGALVCKVNRTLGLGVLGALVLTVISLAVFWMGWYSLILAGILVAVAPWPSPWRTHWELRGYAMTIAYRWWAAKRVPSMSWLGSQFTGPYYWFMSWRPKKTKRELEALVEQVKNGELAKDHPYSRVHDLLRRLELLRS